MLTFEKFSGINNVIPPQRIGDGELVAATNADVGLSGELRRRAGYAEQEPGCHKNVHQAKGFLLATRDGGELVAIDGATTTSLHPALGVARVWYCNLPDGRTAFSNGSITGVADGVSMTGWGMPVPENIGALTPVAGELDPGDYQYQITYVRLSDGLEGGAAFSNPAAVPDGGVLLTGLPQRDGYKINVYLTGANGENAYLAGSTAGSSFSYLGKNDALVLPCKTGNLGPAPVGTVLAFWRSRVLVAVGNVLYASLPNQWELFDQRRDFKQFSAPITLIQPVDDGVYVGTDDELVFLSGDRFDGLAYRQVVSGRVALGSGVCVRGERLKQGDGVGQGSAMICIADGRIVAGFNGGGIVRMTEGRYATGAGEVAATFREADGVPQYIAVVQ